ncbi:hexose transporter Hxt8p [Trichomonascus vanleenenianus]|uniref:hexose transporter Hxt8p n=1 Tax=Trichomonascus vanleenenianus TaxID=2268995 RepID=UPI003ECB30B5
MVTFKSSLKKDREPIDPSKSVEELLAEGKTVLDVLPPLEKHWWHYKHLVGLNILLLGPVLTQITSGYDGSCLNGLQSVETWQEYFDHPTGGRLGTMSNGLTIGSLIALPFVSYMMEYAGRRVPMIFGTSLVVLGAALQGAAQNFNMFVAARIVMGMGNTFASSAASVYLTETAYPSHRESLVGLFQCGWPVGSFIASFITWATYHSDMANNNWCWRLASLLQAAFPAVQLVLFMFSPESPRYLISKGRTDLALDFFVKHHGAGDATSQIVQFQMAVITATIEAEKVQKMSRWSEWYASKAMLHRLMITFCFPVFIQLCGNAIISYYLHIILDNVGITDSITQLKLNIGINAFGLAFDLVCANIIRLYRRRVMIILGFGLCCMAFSIFTILAAVNIEHDYTNKGLGYGAVTMIFVFQGVYHIVAPVVPTYVTEILPFSLRAKGIVIYNLGTLSIGLFNNFVNPIAMAAISWKYYIVFDVWMVVQCLVVYFFFPETLGLGLEEIAGVFGDELVHGADSADAFRRLNDLRKVEELEHVERVDTIVPAEKV